MEKIMPKNLKDIQAWAPADTEIAVRLWKEGKSAREIGRRLSRTRNAIIGKIHRLGLCRKDQAKTTHTIAGKIGQKKRAKIMSVVSPTKDKRPPRPMTGVGNHSVCARPWETRGPHECAFPLTKPDGVYSCCISTDGVYCERHQRIMYLPRKAA